MAQTTCSGCQLPMPPSKDGHEIAVGWTVVRIETHGNITLTTGYLYICPGCTFHVTPNQTTIPGT
jgi:hypothetical protein